MADLDEITQISEELYNFIIFSGYIGIIFLSIAVIISLIPILKEKFLQNEILFFINSGLLIITVFSILAEIYEEPNFIEISIVILIILSIVIVGFYQIHHRDEIDLGYSLVLMFIFLFITIYYWDLSGFLIISVENTSKVYIFMRGIIFHIFFIMSLSLIFLWIVYSIKLYRLVSESKNKKILPLLIIGIINIMVIIVSKFLFNIYYLIGCFYWIAGISLLSLSILFNFDPSIAVLTNRNVILIKIFDILANKYYFSYQKRSYVSNLNEKLFIGFLQEIIRLNSNDILPENLEELELENKKALINRIGDSSLVIALFAKKSSIFLRDLLKLVSRKIDSLINAELKCIIEPSETKLDEILKSRELKTKVDNLMLNFFPYLERS